MKTSSRLSKAFACILIPSSSLLSSAAQAQDPPPHPSPDHPDYVPMAERRVEESEPQVRKGVLITGAVLLGAAQVSMWVGAGIAGTFGRLGAEPDDDTNWAPAFIPYVGPFIAMETANPTGFGVAMLATNGIAQLAGTIVLLVGLAPPEDVEAHEERPSFSVMPTSNGSDSLGAVLTGRF